MCVAGLCSTLGAAEQNSSWVQAMMERRAEGPVEKTTFGTWFKTDTVPCEDHTTEIEGIFPFSITAKNSDGQQFWKQDPSSLSGLESAYFGLPKSGSPTFC